MLVKLGKQVKLPANDHFIAKYGTINALHPQSIFISIHSWATPKHNLELDKKLRSFSHNVKGKIYKSVNYSIFHNKYIVDFDLRESGLQKNKQSFLSVEITLFPQEIIKFPNDIYDNNVRNLITAVMSNIKKNKNFTFTAKKIK